MSDLSENYPKIDFDELEDVGLTLAVTDADGSVVDLENAFSQKASANSSPVLSGNLRLSLVDLIDEKKLPLAVDFLDGQITHRRKTGLGVRQPMARALGLESSLAASSLSVIDATAGLGVDAFILASMGCEVRSIERSPALIEMLNDGYRRLVLASENAMVDETERVELAAIAKRIRFIQGDAIEILQGLDPQLRPQVIYLDPMYPVEDHDKSALPKKTMQLFRRLIGSDVDAARLLEVSRATARDRVVVKRPVDADPLGQAQGGPAPTHSFAGKTARYDMYLGQKR